MTEGARRRSFRTLRQRPRMSCTPALILLRPTVSSGCLCKKTACKQLTFDSEAHATRRVDITVGASVRANMVMQTVAVKTVAVTMSNKDKMVMEEVMAAAEDAWECMMEGLGDAMKEVVYVS